MRSDEGNQSLQVDAGVEVGLKEQVQYWCMATAQRETWGIGWFK